MKVGFNSDLTCLKAKKVGYNIFMLLHTLQLARILISVYHWQGRVESGLHTHTSVQCASTLCTPIRLQYSSISIFHQGPPPPPMFQQQAKFSYMHPPLTSPRKKKKENKQKQLFLNLTGMYQSTGPVLY